MASSFTDSNSVASSANSGVSKKSTSFHSDVVQRDDSLASLSDSDSVEHESVNFDDESVSTSMDPQDQDGIPREDWQYMPGMTRKELLKSICDSKTSAGDLTVVQIAKCGNTARDALKNFFLVVPDAISKGMHSGKATPADSLFALLQVCGIVSVYNECGAQVCDDDSSWDIYAQAATGVDVAAVNFWAVSHCGSHVAKFDVPSIGGVYKWYCLVHHLEADRSDRISKANEEAEKSDDLVDPLAAVLPSERSLIPPHLYLALEQMRLTSNTESTNQGTVSSGLECKHCSSSTQICPAHGFKYFPSSEVALSNASDCIVEHARNCAECPPQVQKKLDLLLKSGASSVYRKACSLRSTVKENVSGSKFVRQLWSRLQARDIPAPNQGPSKEIAPCACPERNAMPERERKTAPACSDLKVQSSPIVTKRNVGEEMIQTLPTTNPPPTTDNTHHRVGTAHHQTRGNCFSLPANVIPQTTNKVDNTRRENNLQLSMIDIKDLPPDVKPILRDPNQTTQEAVNSKSSVYRGVYQKQQKGRVMWRSEIRSNGIKHHLGTYDSEQDAAAIYAWAHLILHGEDETKTETAPDLIELQGEIPSVLGPDSVQPNVTKKSRSQCEIDASAKALESSIKAELKSHGTDVVLSLKDPRYKEELYASFKKIGKRGEEAEHEKKISDKTTRELLSRFKQTMEGGGVFVKLDKRGNTQEVGHTYALESK